MKREPPPYPRNVTGRQIQLARESLRPKVSQEDLCGRLAKIGIILTRTQVAKIESGRRPIFDYELIGIAKALRVPVVSLIQAESLKRQR